MKANKIIIDLMEKNGITYGELGKALGIMDLSTARAWNMLNGKGYKIKMERFIDMLTACGYKLVAVPLSVNVKESWYRVDMPDNEAEE